MSHSQIEEMALRIIMGGRGHIILTGGSLEIKIPLPAGQRTEYGEELQSRIYDLFSFIGRGGS